MSRLTDAMDALEVSFPEHYWKFGKGKTSEREPLYGVQIFEVSDPDEPIIEAENNDPLLCVLDAVSVLTNQNHH